MSDYKPGDVLSYVSSEHHCREWTAFVTENGVAIDTYWRPLGDGQSHHLTERELATAEVRFNIADYDALDRYSQWSRPRWETYHPDDRGRIASQHGLQESLFIRRGALPDISTQIANAQGSVDAAEAELRSAERKLKQRQSELADLETEGLRRL